MSRLIVLHECYFYKKTLFFIGVLIIFLALKGESALKNDDVGAKKTITKPSSIENFSNSIQKNNQKTDEKQKKPSDVSRIEITPIQIPSLPLGLVTFPNGKAINLTVAFGKSLFHGHQQPDDEFWVMTDRTPFIPCKDLKNILETGKEELCNGDNGQVYLLSGFAPSIYSVKFGQPNFAKFQNFIPLKNKDDVPVSGLPSSELASLRTGPLLNTEGKPIPPDPNGIAPTSFVHLQNGKFWILEEFSPSLIEVSAEGEILKRLVFSGNEEAVSIKIAPEIDKKKSFSVENTTNEQHFDVRVEGLALSPDQQFLYSFINILSIFNQKPPSPTSKRWLLKIDIATGEVKDKYLYMQDQYNYVNNTKSSKISNASIIKAVISLLNDRFLVMENSDEGDALYIISIEKKEGISNISKKIILDINSLNDHSIIGWPIKIESLAILSPKELLVSNNNNFGIEGLRPQMFKISLPFSILE